MLLQHKNIIGFSKANWVIIGWFFMSTFTAFLENLEVFRKVKPLMVLLKTFVTFSQA